MPIRKSLREILPKSATRRRIKAPAINNTLENELEDEHINYPEADQFLKQRQTRVPKKIIWLAGVVLVLFLVFLGSSFFTSVKAIIVPKQAKITIDNSVTALSTNAVTSATSTEAVLVFFAVVEHADIKIPINITKKVFFKLLNNIYFTSQNMIKLTAVLPN